MDTEKPDYLVMVAFVLMLFIMFFCRHIGRTDLGLPIGLYLGMVMAAIRIRWDLRAHFWFWATIGVVFLLHFPLLFIVRLPNMQLNRVTLFPIGIADALIILGAVHLVERYIAKAGHSEEES